MFFTYRHWKAKYSFLENDLHASRNNNAEQKVQISQLHSEAALLQKDIQQLQSDLKEATKKPTTSSKKTDDDKSKKLKKDIKDLKTTISLQQEQLDEKEREIEVLSDELAAKKISYYKQIDGKRYKAITLLKADESVAGKGDGRISKSDAEKIFATISDGKSYTQVEKDTMRYLRDNYKWTEGADALFRSKVRSWAAKGHDLA